MSPRRAAIIKLPAKLVAVLLVAALSAAHAHAQPRGACLPHEDAVAKLKQAYGEEKVGLGLGPGGNTVFELFVAETGTWTMLVTRTDGLSCIAASGTDWTAELLLTGKAI